MDIKTKADAQTFIAAWNGRVRPGILAATCDGLALALSVMDSAPARYGREERDDTRAALAHLCAHQAAQAAKAAPPVLRAGSLTALV